MKISSIVTTEYNKCFICHSERNLEMHHCIGGTANRKLSDKYGLTVPLCPDCHRGSEGVHHNRELDLKLIQQCQQAFEEKYSHKMWMQLIRKNYL